MLLLRSKHSTGLVQVLPLTLTTHPLGVIQVAPPDTNHLQSADRGFCASQILKALKIYVAFLTK